MLKRQVGISGAVLLGLGSILGTGVFVSIGIATGIGGYLVLPAIMLAAFVALCNGLSSAQLAAQHPVSGGTYEYGYQYLTPSLGFIAGWLFLLAKTASAASAALGASSYLLAFLGISQKFYMSLSLGIVCLIFIIVLMGIQRTTLVNGIMVSITFLALFLFIAKGFRYSPEFENEISFSSIFQGQSYSTFFYATALLFVSYTGYGRVATLGEEIKNPKRNIPIAVIVTLLVSMFLYLGVGAVGLKVGGVGFFQNQELFSASPLEALSRKMTGLRVSFWVSLGAITAMIGVLLNLVLGLSRVFMAMGRRRDMPEVFARLNKAETTPTSSLIAVCVFIALFVLIGDIKLTWSFSAFCVLIYYGITNLAALKLKKTERQFPKIFSILGLVSCFFLAFWVDPKIWLIGLIWIGLGFIWHVYRQGKIKKRG